MRCFGLLVTLLHISSKTADDIVEDNDQVILTRLEAETFLVIGTHNNDYNFYKEILTGPSKNIFDYAEFKYP